MSARISRVWWDTTRLVELDSLDPGTDVRGAIVKLSPVVSRGATPGRDAVARAVATGAVAATVCARQVDRAVRPVEESRDAVRAVVTALTTGAVQERALERLDEIMGWTDGEPGSP